ncbi:MULTISPECIES: hypothetical protein [Brevibacillus]|uniref:Uncharacterized protein n=1 Tax=Brevibacillus invocatus TaxID=173959 RepID=A0A3M8CGQ8_9BACL|nr:MULTISPECIES: hypothetical protein [Brevibacillus]MCM3080453.1 IseA DL-endopeptidase inhibitor family protein [Brevibacillus invocatus]MCM3430625.1 IseA DL-endopeptidase inhibitor family protein [Brevibacillus invocatus]MDH4616995.1 hypothetical protein [Brevibacillus sp. AY1]RNB74930.1 hypothetical protein EDM52_09435 [Brevibacillus invocatus]
MRKKWIQTIRAAERGFWTIVFSARKRVGGRGVLLPKRFHSVPKIRRFLRKNMTTCLANRVIGNLDLRRIKGRLAVPVGDGIGAPPIVKTKVLSKGTRRVTIAVWFAFDPSDQFFRVYQLKKVRGRWIVVGRHPLDYPFDKPGRRRFLAGCCAPCRGRR